MSVDPAGFELASPNRKGFNLIESVNQYSYVGNNPVKYTDPTGMKSTKSKMVYFPHAPCVTIGIPQGCKPSSLDVLIENRISYREAGFKDVGPCAFRTGLAIAESLSGKNLSKNEIRNLQESLRNSKILGPSGKDKWYVGNWSAVVNSALEVLGSDLRVTVKGNEGAKPVATALFTKTNSYGSQHWVEGDANGNIRYDGYGENTMEGAVINKTQNFYLKGDKNE